MLEQTPYENTTLEIEILPAMGSCKRCEELYDVVSNRKVCPRCDGEEYKLISGQEFNIKEIVAY